MASNNDSGVRDFDMEKFQPCKEFHFEWPVNVSSAFATYVSFCSDWLFVHVGPIY